jgi:transposase
MKGILSQFWSAIQASLFPFLEEELGPLTKKQQELISTLELIQLESYLSSIRGIVGRPEKSRRAIARAFVAKAIYNMPTTRMLIERLQTDISLRRICGWENKFSIPKECTFSRAFAEFSKTKLPETIHEALIIKITKDKIVLHNSRDSTKTEAREKPLKKQAIHRDKKKRGRPKKGVIKEKPAPTRLQKQSLMTLEQMLEDLPKECDIGVKKNSKGYAETWIGYKTHIDTIDGDVPVSCIVTSASMHDSQVAIPLAEITAKRITSLYDLMDAAYDCPEIKTHSMKLGHIPIIDNNPRRNKEKKHDIEQENKAQKTINLKIPEKIRYNQRSSAERVNSRLKDSYGGRMVRVRGHAKVYCHIMFGLLALTADQLLKIVQ